MEVSNLTQRGIWVWWKQRFSVSLLVDTPAEHNTARKSQLLQQQLGWCLWKASDGHGTMGTFLWLQSFPLLLLLLVALGEKKWEQPLFLEELMCFRSSGFSLPAIGEWGAASSSGLPVWVWTGFSALFHELKGKKCIVLPALFSRSVWVASCFGVFY